MIDRRLLPGVGPAAVAVGLLSAAAAGLAVGQAWCLSRALDLAFLQQAGLEAAAPSLGLGAAFSLLRAGAGCAADLTAAGGAIRLKSQLRNALARHLIALGPAFAQSGRTGDLAAVFVDGIEAVEPYLRQYLPQLLTAVLVPLILLAVILPTDPLSALVLALTAPLLPLFMILIGRAAEALTRRQFGALSQLSAQFLDVIQGLTTLKLLRRSAQQAETIRRAGEAYRAVTLRLLRVAFLTGLALEMTATLSTAIVAVQIGLRLLAGRLGFQQAMFVLVLAPEFYLPLRALGSRFHAGAAGAAAAERIFGLLSLPAPPTAARPIPPAAAAAAAPALSIRDVRYSYDDARPALNGLTLEIPAAATTALVGPSGAGKSTLVFLLLRFLSPSAGEILVDGRRLAEVPLDEWRKRVAWVPQSPHLFPRSLADNLRLAWAEATDTQLRQALAQAQLADLEARLPDGLGTCLGERGARLSAGEAQRLAIARALLRRAEFVILDEPTAAIDPEVESRFQAAAEVLLRGRTVLVVAHRLSTVQRADQIVVIQAGRALEHGTHHTLWQAGGLYRRLLSTLGDPA